MAFSRLLRLEINDNPIQNNPILNKLTASFTCNAPRIFKTITALSAKKASANAWTACCSVSLLHKTIAKGGPDRPPFSLCIQIQTSGPGCRFFRARGNIIAVDAGWRIQNGGVRLQAGKAAAMTCQALHFYCNGGLAPMQSAAATTAARLTKTTLPGSKA